MIFHSSFSSGPIKFLVASERPIIGAIKIIRKLNYRRTNDRMAAFPSSNTLSSASSLSYHHLFSHGNNTSTANNHPSNTSLINDIPSNSFFDPNTDLSFCQPTSYFDVPIPSSSSSSHHHADPFVRHLFNYRQTDPNNQTGNYYSNTSTGSFVNAFDYPPPPSTGIETPPQNLPYHHQQQQNIYPWMRRIHHGCGEYLVYI